MAALLDGTLDASQGAEVQARVAASPLAAAEFADLQRFRDETTALPPTLHGPGSSVSQARLEMPTPGKITEFPARRWAQLIALAAAAVLLLSVGWWAEEAGKSLRGAVPLWADADLSGLPVDLRHRVERAARTGTLEPAALPADLRPVPGTLAGDAPDPATLRQLAPVGQVVRETEPTLRWTPLDGATGYVVYVAANDGGSVVRQELPGSATTWAPPAPLTRGATYEWQVEACQNGKVLDRAPRPPAPEARFQVLAGPPAAELDQLEKRYARYPLILGTAYERVGLEEEALRQFGVLARQHPNSPAAKRLLQAARAVASP